ncbi:MAG: glycosyltransferase family 4 protein [Nitrosomonas sp.]|nr:glycosyltransferase family 4 protein [Nitrosomonas sp.]
MIEGVSFSTIAAPLFSFLATYFFVAWLIKGKVAKILDYPNSRSLHSEPIPRTGGVGLLFGILTTWLLFAADLPLSIWIGVCSLALISFADDIFGLPVWSRLLIQCMVAGGISVMLLLGAYGWMMMLLFTIGIVWMSNLYNFMDGSDGLAGGMAFIGFGYYGLAALLAGNNDYAMINFSVAAAATAFLSHNFYPARIFMGDVGAVPLGFLAAGLGLVGWIDGLWSLWLPLLVFSPFIADATVTLIKRCLRGEKFWLAHCEHYYQRAVQSGLGHRNTALLGYILMLLAGASAVWTTKYDLLVQHWVGVIWGCVYLTLMFVSERFQRHRIGSE